MEYYFIVFLVSIGASFFSGLLAIGGGVILIPAYLYLMPMLGFESFTVNVITGIAATQAFAGGYFSYLNHKKYGAVEKEIAYEMCLYALPGALVGAVVSKFMSGTQLLVIYLIILTLAAISTLLPKTPPCEGDCVYESDNPNLSNFLVCGSTAISSSMGFGGAINFIPILNRFYKMPIKISIATVSFLVMLTTGTTLFGKFILGMVPFVLIPFIFAGSALGAKVGAKLSRKLSNSALKTIFLIVLSVIWIRIFLTVIE